MTDLSSRIESLSPQRRALFDMLVRRQQRDGPAIARRPVRDSFPMSFAQQRMWFLSQYEPDSPAYNIYRALRIEGAVDLRALERSLTEMTRRHEVLRSTYQSRDGEAVQRIAAPSEQRITVADIGDVPSEQRYPHALRRIKEEVSRPFDLASGSLLRTLLLRLGPDDHILVVTVHHIVSDGWSLGLMIREITTMYGSFTEGAPSPLPELPIQYADFAAWQRDWLDGEVLDRHLAYWRLQLADAPPVFDLRAGLPRPARRSHRGGRHSFRIPGQVTAPLRDLSTAERTTLFAVAVSAFKVLLARYSGQVDLSVGTVIANRTRPEIEGLVGFFVNTLVLRTDLAGNPTFREALRRVREVTLQAYEHQDLPFERLVEELRPARHVSHTPLFQVMFAWQGGPTRPADVPGLELSEVEIHNEAVKFDLSVSLTESPDGVLLGSVEYPHDMLDHATVVLLAEHYQRILRAAGADPDRRIWSFDLLAPQERDTILRAYNDTQVSAPAQPLVPELIDRQAERTPDAVAVDGPDRSLTYRELVRSASRLAHRLRRTGVGPDQRVGVFLGRSADLVVSLLAVLKAGGCYVPLEPSHPAERLRFLLRDTAPVVVLTNPGLPLEKLGDDVPLLRLDEQTGEPAAESSPAPGGAVTADHLAYVIYTSGSSGRPKGVMISHGGMLNRLAWLQRSYELGENDRVLQKTPFSVDTSVEEFFCPLMAGGRVVVAAPDGHRDPAYLTDVVVRKQVTVLRFVPSMLALFLQEPAVSACRSLRHVFCGGEVLEPDLARVFFEKLDAQLHNFYGPTEASIDATYWNCRPREQSRRIPVGRPMANTQIYILDEHLNPLPQGVPGELCIGGAGLARGYLNRAGLTAERFVPDPFGIPGGRLYRTGDRARHRPDGTIEYLGRLDRQVKIRGFRIEPGELEVVLADHPGVRAAAVVPNFGPAGETLLFAYVEPDPRFPPAVGELRRYLQARLPSYLQPTSIVFLPTLPKSGTGKIDRRALPAPGGDRPELGALTLPTSPEEGILAGVWSDVLGIDRVGVDDNFFALGGDSIRAIQVVSRAKQQGVSVSLQRLFQHQTIRELAQLPDGEPADDPTSPPLARFGLISEADRARLPADVEDAYPLSALQAGMIFESEMSPGHPAYHYVATFHLRGRFDQDALEESVRLLVSRHPMLRTSVDLGSYHQPLQLVHRRCPSPLMVDDLRAEPARRQEEYLAGWIERERRRPFSLTDPPLLRLYVHRRSDSGFQFTLSSFAVILDGWSNAAMLTELFQTYGALRSGGLAPSPAALAGSFGDFIRLEQAALESPTCAAYWSAKLRAIEMAPAWRWLAPGPERPAADAERGSHDIDLAAGVQDGLRKLASQASAPLKSVLLAAHLRVMSLLSGDPKVVTGLVSNGRVDDLDGEQVLGQFLNTVPLVTRLAAGNWLALVRQVFDAERELLPFRRYPVGARSARGAGTALVETGFNFVHFHVYQLATSIEDLDLIDARVRVSTNFTLFTEFSVDPVSGQIQLTLEHALTVIGRQQIERIGRYYVTVLTAMAGRPLDRHEDHRRLLPADEYRLAVPTWNQTQAELPASSIPELFEKQVARTPDGAALISDDQLVSYRDLNSRANQLAHYLRRLGAGAETVVGVRLERSPDLTTALLAVLKSGGAALPIDPAQPLERTRSVLADARASVLLTRSVAAGYAGGDPVKVVDLEVAAGDIASESGQNPAVAITGDQLACVIFTSGSTGRPKGVGLAHRQILNRLSWMWHAYPFQPGEVSCQRVAVGFVDSLWDQLGPLLRGMPSAVVSDRVALNPFDLVRFLARHRVTRILLVPTLLRVILDSYDDLRSRLPALRLWVSSGEALPADLHALFTRRMPDRVLVNVYGASEAWDGTWFQPGRDPVPAVSVPVGRPIANMRAYLLDSNLQPVPLGLPGEVYLGGTGLARGYVHAPGLTAERFVPDPFGSGERLYRTGDSGRYLPDGTIELLGRVDSQISIRGFRVEPAEVEAVLCQHPAVALAVLSLLTSDVARELVAFVVASSPGQLDRLALRDFLRERLPSYLQPARIVQLEALPRTSTGKVDRRALQLSRGQAPAQGPPGSATARAGEPGPQTATEAVLCALFAELLGRDQVGARDNFFELGGDSLVAMRLAVRVRAKLRTELAVRALFDAPTPRGLARRIDAARVTEKTERSAAGELGTATGHGSSPPLVSFAQQRLWFLSQLHPSDPFYNVHLAVRLSGTLSLDALRRGVREIVRRHQVLRTTFTLYDGKPVQIIRPDLAPESNDIDLRGLSPAESQERQRELMTDEIRRPFDLESGPLLRVTLIRLAEQEHVALFVAHHIVCDAWSIDVFASELSTLYAAFAAGERSPLPDLAVQYADYAAWQRRRLSGKAMASLLGFWLGQLGGVGEAPALPTDLPRATTPAHRGGTETLVVAAPLRDAVVRLGLDNGATLFMCLLTALAVVLRRRCGRDDVVIGTDVAGRDRLQAEQLIGFFVNQVVLRADLSGDPTFRELLDRVRNMTLEAYEHQEMPFDQLVQALRPARDLAYAPLFQAKLVMPNVPAQRVAWPGIAVSPIDLPRRSAQLDLNIRAIDRPDGLELSAEYDRDLFRPGTVQLMISQLAAVLQRAAADPEARLSALDDLMSSVRPAERTTRTASSRRPGRARRRPVDG